MAFNLWLQYPELAQELKNLTSLTKFELVKRRKERYRKF